MRFERQSGIFLHLTSLPSPHGIGDLGEGAREFVDFLARTDQSLWQFCPVGPTADVHGHSPYQSHSTFAGNPLLVDLRDLVERGFLTESHLDAPAFPDDRVVYDRVAQFKHERLRLAFEGFRERDDERTEAFRAFREREAGWLSDYALFMALRTEFGGPWTEWPAGLKNRDPGELETYRAELAEEVRYREFVQWVFDEQWRDLRAYARERGIDLFGDLPIYVAFDSADVWANPGVFRLTADNELAEVAGVPPNPGDSGQRWGNPVYDWDYLERTDYDWWLRRLDRLFDLVDVVRIDHFKGFDEFWAIPAEASDPAAGRWYDAPGVDFFESVEAELGDLPFVVEDLGFLDPGVVALRERFDFPGMRVPQYADWCEEGHMYQPMHYPEDAAAYTSTHDTDTVVGYYDSLSARQRDCLHYNLGSDGEEIEWDLIEAVWNSSAAIAMTTPQDLLGLGSEARINTPGTATGNWQWRLEPGALDSRVEERLREVTDATIR